MKLVFTGCLVSLLIGSAGCVGGGPHLSFEREHASPAGEVDNIVPTLEEPTQMQGTGATLSNSGKFRNFGGTSFMSGGSSQGELYRTVGSELSLGKRLVGKKE